MPSPLAIAKRVATVMLTAVAALVVVIASILLLNTPLTTGYRELNDRELDRYVDALAEHGAAPADFVVELFEERDVVILGEGHRVREDLAFVQTLLPHLYDAGVRTVVSEFGDAAHQADADRLVTASNFDRELAKRLTDHGHLLWVYEDYLELLRAVWRINQTRPPGTAPFRIVLGAPTEPADKDAFMARLVVERQAAGDKVLVYCGAFHGFTRFRQPMPLLSAFGARGDRLGNKVYAAIGERVAYVQLHMPAVKRWALFVPSLYDKRTLFPFEGVIDRAAERLDRPVGFATSLEPFASLVDNSSYLSMHRAPVRLDELADGYIALEPLRDLHTVRPFDDLDQPSTIALLRQRYPELGDAVAQPAELRQILRDGAWLPEQNYTSVDRSGFDQPTWVPNISALWPALAIALVGLGVVWYRRAP